MRKQRKYNKDGKKSKKRNYRTKDISSKPLSFAKIAHLNLPTQINSTKQNT